MIKLSGGKFKGKKIIVPDSQKTRPTLAKTRSAIFDVISNRYFLNEFEFVDLFSGSGAVGFEALSRGVNSVSFVEVSKICSHFIRQNIESLNSDISHTHPHTATTGYSPLNSPAVTQR